MKIYSVTIPFMHEWQLIIHLSFHFPSKDFVKTLGEHDIHYKLTLHLKNKLKA